MGTAVSMGVLWAGAGGGPEPAELQTVWGPTLLSRALGKLWQPSGSGQALVLGPGMVATTTGGPEGGRTKLRQGRSEARPSGREGSPASHSVGLHQRGSGRG